MILRSSIYINNQELSRRLHQKRETSTLYAKKMGNASNAEACSDKILDIKLLIDETN